MNWYCVHTRPLKEQFSTRYLSEMLGLEVYLPLLKQVRRIRRVKQTVTSALFPRYLFCRFAPDIHSRAVRYAPEILDVVSFGGSPAVVSDDLVSELKSWAGVLLDESCVRRGIQCGDTVEITSGALIGLRATVVREMPDSDRVTLLLNILGGETRVSIEREQLECVGSF